MRRLLRTIGYCLLEYKRTLRMNEGRVIYQYTGEV